MRRLVFAFLLSACTSPAAGLDQLAEAPSGGCEVDGDCCVVTDACKGGAYVVTQQDYPRARELASDSQSSGECYDCIPPRVDVRCDPDSRKCVGRTIDYDAPEAPGLAPDHCGSVLSDPWPSRSADPDPMFTCGG
jgi:hypothetical protein